MSDKFKQVLLTNNDNGPRGISVKGGTTILEAGETRSLEIPVAELEDLPKHFKASDDKEAKKAKAAADEKAADEKKAAAEKKA